MKKIKEKKLNKRNLFILCAIIGVIITGLLFLFLHKQSKELNLSSFEKVAVSNYLEDYLSLDKLYLLSGKFSYNELQYTQAKIKETLDSYYNQNPSETIPASVIITQLENKYNISSDTLDFHGILISDYEYLPAEDAFKRVEGANKGMGDLENQVETTASKNGKTSIKTIEKKVKDSYIVYFDVVSLDSEDNIIDSGNVTIKVVDDNYELESCTFDN